MKKINLSGEIQLSERIRISKSSLLLLVCAPAFNFLVYYSGRLLSMGRQHESLMTGLDQKIPVVPSMIWVYWGCYLFWLISFVALSFGEKRKIYQFFTAFYFGEIICFLFFVFMPTTMTRAAITGTGANALLMDLTYQIDRADNLFPSIHCFVSWLCYVGVRNRDGILRKYRWIALILAALVCVATVTVKQHVVADVCAGVALAEIGYLLAKKIHV